MNIQLMINGIACSADVEDRTLLIDLLRDGYGLTGTHVGCDTSQCGCCTVHVDGEAVKSCTMLAVQADGSEILTIEGLAIGSSGAAREVHPVQAAFAACHGLQCGFCTPGMIMASCDLLNRHPDPTEAQILEGLSGNLCRCTGYVNIVKAVRQAATQMRNQPSSRSAP
ncbi:MAG: (2Fe-2S)-binding protein [Betaproteobacteria bacterium]|nr:(2Fe-2S)-binding protein [Pseudomonadota bacterium]NBO11213.1 (2Fe-2S)-binding protein [Betaproteobacteria bacterium]NBO43116.1 (2Fe-2S)-binding protein [Betaproteobacteria bacterium]NBP10291.1 (2Fe-2S)-binding protein [Betaproteobacteria bacterium]NBP61502.1 (2Fe-2S)-binding protein [Betaproteobacteria bacterium]